MKFRFALAILLASGLWAQAPASKEVEVFGQKIHYVEAGAGPTVILLHGLGGDGTNWALTTPALAKNYHVLVPDQIGFGESPKPMINYRVATLVDFLAAFTKKLGITKATLVGNSLGGWTAIAYTLAHPDQVERLVLVDSAGYSLTRTGVQGSRETLTFLDPSSVAVEKILMQTILANKAMVTDAFAESAFAEHLRKNDGYTIDRFIESILRNEDVVDGKLGAIKVPTLVVWGREDALIPLPAGELMSKEIAGSSMVILDHCGHVPQLECAVPFDTALMKFLNGGAQPSTGSR
ncbi:MAG TPA: alpha/beta hydrolase [Bryobacteraceae bacterium]|nr:alpha/beta hydrolase [Bryobacteraceae bacterium]